MEANAEAAPFVIRWSRSQHHRALSAPDQEHLVLIDDDRLVGFVLLAGLRNPNASIELQRIVVSSAGQGFGRQAIALVTTHAFDRLGAHRLWLDAKVENHRAIRAYERAGFVHEGVLRDALLTDGRHESLIVMSILKPAQPHVRRAL